MEPITTKIAKVIIQLTIVTTLTPPFAIISNRSSDSPQNYSKSVAIVIEIRKSLLATS